MRAGDVVDHGPTGERWIVAAVDGDRLSPAGWPPCEARASDCTLVRSCTDQQHREMVRGVAKSSHPIARPLGARHTCDACETRDPDDDGSWVGFDGPSSGRDKRARLAARGIE